MKVGDLVWIKRGSPYSQLDGFVGRVGWFCEDGVEVLVEVEGPRNATFGAWPINKAFLEAKLIASKSVGLTGEGGTRRTSRKARYVSSLRSATQGDRSKQTINLTPKRRIG